MSTVGFAESDGWCWIGAILNQDDANDVQVFKYSTKNKDLTIQTIGSTFPTPTRRDINLSLGARWASFPTTGFQGAFDIAAWGVWADNWDLTKLRSFIKDPWDIVQPRVGYVPKVIAAAPGGNDGAAMYHHFVRTGVYG